MRRVIVIAAVVVTVLGVGTQMSAAGPPGHQPPDLVALGDSFAAGTGNTPYVDEDCGRSKYAAYAEVLDRFRAVTLRAFPACAGRTTITVAAEQLDAITQDTDIVTVQALGNDFGFGALSGLCLGAILGATCHRNEVLPDGSGRTVQQLLDSIPLAAPNLLSNLYAAIDEQIELVGAHAKVIVVDYGDPFPSPKGWVGPFCPTMDREELGVAAEFANSVNAALKQAVDGRPNYRFADAAPRFRGLDVCGFATAFFRPPLPGLTVPGTSPDIRGVIHPNRLGQGIYAAVLATRLY